ncbi:NADPH-dependent 1-acyldihydroxyacetone phosphate [Cyphellophora attinorum]|uniref:NADPH-dependent 1-acyldihydroxyacetone phosphate n=1 Tax=Cyphellophora attinorum TaxID=1664694 RepID=A0A0N1H3A2_9EURO|nr:NADPH-dependent 1-acyldihydroxyacetone phosphate [Phialophora attinorum]KPI35982.1 NADPH-dependent 1-acyldihydroxyacetone phosphate [Phialophora attinorum]
MPPEPNKFTALITGCSDGGLGAALAKALHSRGVRVLATARDLSKTESLQKLDIKCFELDVLNDESIQSCLATVKSTCHKGLNMLINNAGGGHYMPFLHLDLQKARELFDVNLWSHLAVTQAFLPLLMQTAAEQGIALLVNQTSISSTLRTPYHSAYSASKAALASFSATQRIELRPFGIRVVDLKTGSTESNFSENRTNALTLPPDSPYMPIKEKVENVIRGDATEAYAEDQDKWAQNVVDDLLREGGPPAEIWRGGAAGRVKLLQGGLESVVPPDLGDGGFMKLGGLDLLEDMVKKERAE